MGVELRKSFLPAQTVKKVIEGGYETAKYMNGGRNPSQEQKESIKKFVIEQAKRVEKDRGVK